MKPVLLTLALLVAPETLRAEALRNKPIWDVLVGNADMYLNSAALDDEADSFPPFARVACEISDRSVCQIYAHSAGMINVAGPAIDEPLDEIIFIVKGAETVPLGNVLMDLLVAAEPDIDASERGAALKAILGAADGPSLKDHMMGSTMVEASNVPFFGFSIVLAARD